MALNIPPSKVNGSLKDETVLDYLFVYYKITDFIIFFSPFILYKQIRNSRYEFVNPRSYLLSIIVLVVIFFTITLFGKFVESQPYLFLTAPVIVSALYGGIGPALLSIFGSVIMANFILGDFKFSFNLFVLTPTNIAFILEGLFISWLSIIQKRIQQAVTLNLMTEQSARLKAHNTNINLKRLEKQKDDFIAIAAHELKNPLASIKAFTQIMETRIGNKKDKPIKEYLNQMGTQINRLDELVSELFDVSRMAGGGMTLRKQMVDCDEFLLSLIIDLKHTINTHKLIVEGQTKSMVNLDPGRMHQVIINLVSNAVKYSPMAGRVIIHLATDPKNVIISVQDFGDGISSKEQKRIFERFYRANSQTAENTSGLGLGLYIVSEIIRLHNGKIWLISSPKQGATFFISIPKK